MVKESSKVKVIDLVDRSRDFRVGNVIYLTGDIAIARDQAHKRLCENVSILKDVVDLPVYHCGPIAIQERGGFKFLGAGPTTSNRMEKYTEQMILKYHTPLFIGKGGFGDVGKAAIVKYGSFYCEFTGGASAYAVSKIDSILKIFFEDLGTPEALWIVSVKDFGPLLVTQDSEGNDLRSDVYKNAVEKMDRILREYRL
jgi:tartrate/fumarate subfamily iron-sulfur-dependent hydro-lyase beta chain